MSARTEDESVALLDVVPTVTIGRQRTTHSYRVDIQDNQVVILTHCDIDLTGVEYTMTHGIISCLPCAAAWDDAQDRKADR